MPKLEGMRVHFAEYLVEGEKNYPANSIERRLDEATVVCALVCWMENAWRTVVGFRLFDRWQVTLPVSEGVIVGQRLEPGGDVVQRLPTYYLPCASLFTLEQLKGMPASKKLGFYRASGLIARMEMNSWQRVVLLPRWHVWPVYEEDRMVTEKELAIATGRVKQAPVLDSIQTNLFDTN